MYSDAHTFSVIVGSSTVSCELGLLISKRVMDLMRVRNANTSRSIIDKRCRRINVSVTRKVANHGLLSTRLSLATVKVGCTSNSVSHESCISRWVRA
jgi:hypothetical protein